MRRDPAHRTSARTLRQLAAGHVFYELGEDSPGQWDNFATRTIGLAVQRRMAEEFEGNPEKVQMATVQSLSQTLHVDVGKWGSLEQLAFRNFAVVLHLAPEITNWTRLQKQGLLKAIRTKASSDETEYLRLLQRHVALKQIFLRLGSERAPIKAANI